jgi:hypothetical protein
MFEREITDNYPRESTVYHEQCGHSEHVNKYSSLYKYSVKVNNVMCDISALYTICSFKCYGVFIIIMNG